MFIFRQLFDPQSWTYTYLLADGTTGEAVLIDPEFALTARGAAQIRELGFKLIATLDTHSMPAQTGQTAEFGGAETESTTAQPQNIFDFVRSSAWTSRPMTGSNSIIFLNTKS